MSTLFVDADKLEAQSENINLCETDNKNVNITLHEIIDEIQLGESTVEIRNAIEIIKFILGFIPVINCITDIYQLVDDVTQALSDDGK